MAVQIDFIPNITFDKNGRLNIFICKIGQLDESELEKYFNENQNNIDSTPLEFGQEFDFPVNSAVNLPK